MRYATVTVVEFRGSARREELVGIDRYLETAAEVATYQIEKNPGRLAIAADVLTVDMGQAAEIASRTVRQAMQSAGWNRAVLLWESSVVPVRGVEFRRPRGLQQMGYAA